MKNLEVVIQEAASKAATEAVEKVLQEANPTLEYLSTVQCAKYLGCSTQHLEIQRHRGGGIPFVKWGRLIRYRKCDVDSYMNFHLCSSTAERS